MEHEEEDQKLSKYSSGINILKRIDILWRDTHSHSRAGMFYNWNMDLDRIWLELARDLKEKPKDKNLKYDTVKTAFDEFDEKLKNLDDNSSTGFQPPSTGDIKQRSDQYKTLMEKQLFLARLENQIGKGTTTEDEDDDDM